MAAADLDALVALAARCPEAAHWSRADFERAIRGEFQGWVAEKDARVRGFIVARVVADEVEVVNLAVEPGARRAGIGSRLLGEALEHARRAGALRVFLEVRESNHNARAFYERHGFRLSSRRARYYSDPREDALVFSRNLDD